MACYAIDHHPAVFAFVKNAGLGFAIPYLYNGQTHDYVPDFLIRLKSDTSTHLILETKGYAPLKDVKQAAANRWVSAVNTDCSYGYWQYAIAEKLSEVSRRIDDAMTILHNRP